MFEQKPDIPAAQAVKGRGPVWLRSTAKGVVTNKFVQASKTIAYMDDGFNRLYTLVVDLHPHDREALRKRAAAACKAAGIPIWMPNGIVTLSGRNASIYNKYELGQEYTVNLMTDLTKNCP